MSSITMAADSTQDNPYKIKKKQNKKKKHRSHSTSSNTSTDSPIKKKSKKTGAKEHRHRNSSDSNCESDLDLSKELLPISGYTADREAMIENMFKSISSAKLKSMLPEILQPLSLKELKKLCLMQLHVMSSKRIRKILEGIDSEMISSSEDDDNEGDKINAKHSNSRNEDGISKKDNQSEDCELPKDSNCHKSINIIECSKEKDLQSSHETLPKSQILASSEKSLSDQHPRFVEGDEGVSRSSVGSETRKEMFRKTSIIANDKLNLQGPNKEVIPNLQEGMTNKNSGNDSDFKRDGRMSKTQLEILELEMRARAIKAMLKAQEENERKSKRKSCEQDLESCVSHTDNKKHVRLSQSDHSTLGYEMVRGTRDVDHRSKDIVESKTYGKRLG